MKFHVSLLIRISATLGLMASAKVDAASIYRIDDLGANVSNLQLNNVGQVAGLRDNPWEPSSGFLFNDKTGQTTPLAAGVTPMSLTDDGRVIDASGPFGYYTTEHGDNRNLVGAGFPTAANHLGQLVGSFSTTPYYPLENTIVYSPYVYTPYKPGSGLNGQYIDSLNQIYGLQNASEVINYQNSVNNPTGRGSYGGPADLANIHPTGINDSGQVVGNRYPSDFVYGFNPGPPYPYNSHAFLNKQDLGTLGGTNSEATAINNAGQVTGQADTSSGSSHAFLYTGGKMIDLGLLPGMTSSEGLGLDKKGDVVGTSGGHAFLYNFSTGIMEDLNDRLPATLGLTLDQAIAINDAGQILAYGHGADGVEHGLLLSPLSTPEPTTLALLGLGAAGYGVRLRRNSKRVQGTPSGT